LQLTGATLGTWCDIDAWGGRPRRLNLAFEATSTFVSKARNPNVALDRLRGGVLAVWGVCALFLNHFLERSKMKSLSMILALAACLGSRFMVSGQQKEPAKLTTDVQAPEDGKKAPIATPLPAPQVGLKLAFPKWTMPQLFAFSPDGKYVAIIDKGWGLSGVHVLDRKSGKRVFHRSFGGGRNLGLLSFTSDGKTLLCGGESQILAIDPTTGRCTEHPLALGFRGRGDSIAVCELSPDAAMVAVTLLSEEISGGPVQLWDWKNNKLLATLDGGDKDLKHCGPLAFSPDGKRLACWTYPWIKPKNRGPDKAFEEDAVEARKQKPLEAQKIPPWRMQIWDVAERKLLCEWQGSPPIFRSSMGYLGNVTFRFIEGGEFLVGSYAHSICVWNAATGKLKTRFEVPIKPGWRVGPATDGKLVATTRYFEDVVHFWDLATAREVGQLRRDHDRDIDAMALSPDGSILVTSEILGSGAEDGSTVLIIDVPRFPPK
jgi:hypothetical protein